MPGTHGGDLGVDVARFGDDSTVIYHRRGDYYQRHDKAHNRDTMFVTGMVVNATQATRAKRIKVDDTGVGGGVTDRLRELQAYTGIDPEQRAAALILANVEIIPINVGESPRADISDERFKNLRAEVNWQTRERFVDGKITLIDVPAVDGVAGNTLDDMLSQAAQIKYKLTSSGEIQIESKADMKKRTKGVSPDDWDALVLAGAEPQFPGAGMLEYYRQLAADAEGQRANPTSRPKPAEVPQSLGSPFGGVPLVAHDKVRMIAPEGCSTVYGMDGTRYEPAADRSVSVNPDDVTPLTNAGFVRVDA